ncbi:hypothetical protein O2K51_01860 [Apibacter raozihei]|uniref:hypothetical protein n=1 Tax=Apibacter raozihei TaxID=2500547 RepID=UPI0013E2A8B9
MRIFYNNISYLIFDEFPPAETDKLSNNQINNLSGILSDLTGVDVIHDDRELFIIMSNDKIILEKVIAFLEM